jgi:hypothetical protein
VLVPAAGALALLLGVTAGIIAFRPGGPDRPPHKPAGHAPTTAPAASASPSAAAARYVTPFDFCALVTTAQVEQLMPGAEKIPT